MTCPPGAEKRQPSVWIIVLNWNRPQDTLQCVSSLRLLDYPSYRILIVDNGSTDDSVEQFRELTGVELLVSEENAGFGVGNNLGIEYALAHGAEYTLLLNNDTTVSPSLISNLVRIAEADAQIGIVGPTIYYAGDPSQVWFSGMRFRFGLYVIRVGPRLGKQRAAIEVVDFVSGCGMLVRRELWNNVGLFDPRFFMYYEDLDLCVRAAKAGYRIVSTTQAHMWHALSASTGGPDSPMKQYYQVKSTFLFCEKHTRGLTRVVTLSIRLTHAGWMAVRQVARGRLPREAIRLYLKGIAETLVGSRAREPRPNSEEAS